MFRAESLAALQVEFQIEFLYKQFEMLKGTTIHLLASSE